MTAPADDARVPRILVVDDDLALARLLLELLAAHGYSDVRHVTTAAAALPAARDADIVLLECVPNELGRGAQCVSRLHGWVRTRCQLGAIEAAYGVAEPGRKWRVDA